MPRAGIGGRAFDFLREDILHVNTYFQRGGVAVLTGKELFDFIVDPTITDATLDESVSRMMEHAST